MFLLCFLMSGVIKTAEIPVVVKIAGYNTPVLKNRKINPLLSISVINKSGKPVNITCFKISLEGTTNISSVKNISIWLSNYKWNVTNGKLYGFTNNKELNVKGSIFLSDTLHFILSAELCSNSKLSDVISIDISSVATSLGEGKIENRGLNKKNHVGIAVRGAGDDGVNTYRIPGIVTTEKGTLLAVYDVRRDTSRDLQGNIDIGLSRSTDKGETWEPMRIVLDMKEAGGLPQKFNGVSDANILVDRFTGKIYVFGLWMHGVLDKNGRWVEKLTEDSDAWGHQWKGRGSQPGLDPKHTCQLIYSVSNDDGLTWSDPVNITSMVKKPEWWLFAPSPGNGITMSNGTLVFPSQGRDEHGIPFSCITYSMDGGVTWTTSAAAYHNTTESTVVQLSDGSLMLNMRHNKNKGAEKNGRAVTVSANYGKTWKEHVTSRRELIEPTCMGSLYMHTYTSNGKSVQMLLFSNPESKYRRENMTLKCSFDDGLTWPENNRLYYDQFNSMGYSCITSVDNESVGIFYEAHGSRLVFIRIPVKEILN